MYTSRTNLGSRLFLVMGILAVGLPAAQAQFRIFPSAQQINPINPNWFVAPGLTQQQYLHNIRARAAAYSTIPPWLFGYNPYPSPVVRPFPTPLYGGGFPAVNPYTPYAPALAGATPYNPYSPISPYGGAGGYGGYGNPYYPYSYSYGQQLYGAADIMRAAGQTTTYLEQARLLREQANQAKIETARKRFDHEMYIRANTPSFSEEQAKIARLTLKRIQNNSSVPEIFSGKSLNYLLDDLRKFPGKKISSDTLPLDGEVLSHLNVTKSFGNLGLLRNDGRFTWPSALHDVVDANKQKDIEIQAQTLIQQAANGNVDTNLLKDLRVGLDKIRTDLTKKVNEVPTSQYIEAKRFLNDFNDAGVALEKGDAKVYFNFQKFVSGGKTVQEVVDYLVAHGLRFAPAVNGDESAYQALHSSLAAFSIAMNAQLGSSKE